MIWQHGQSRRVTQYHFLKWPDFGVPANIPEFLRMVRAVRSFVGFRSTEPIVVHCRYLDSFRLLIDLLFIDLLFIYLLFIYLLFIGLFIYLLLIDLLLIDLLLIYLQFIDLLFIELFIYLLLIDLLFIDLLLINLLQNINDR